MPPGLRLFFAVEIPDPAAARLAEAAADLARSRADVKWVHGGVYHMTLAFLGDTPEERLEPARECGRRAVRDLRAHDAVFTGLGAFPSWKGPRIVWAGLGPGGPELVELASRLNAELSKAGFPVEGRPFVAHATLGRVRRPGPELQDLARKAERWSAPAAWQESGFRVSELVLFKSTLTPEGPVYEAVGRFPLGGAPE